MVSTIAVEWMQCQVGIAYNLLSTVMMQLIIIVSNHWHIDSLCSCRRHAVAGSDPFGRYMRPGGETDLAMQLWWRSVALQVLHTYMTSVLARGLVRDVALQVGD